MDYITAAMVSHVTCGSVELFHINDNSSYTLPSGFSFIKPQADESCTFSSECHLNRTRAASPLSLSLCGGFVHVLGSLRLQWSQHTLGFLRVSEIQSLFITDVETDAALHGGINSKKLNLDVISSGDNVISYLGQTIRRGFTYPPKFHSRSIQRQSDEVMKRGQDVRQ